MGNRMVEHCKSAPFRLLIADDHLIFLQALKSFLEKFHVVAGTAVDGRSMVSEALRLKPDVIIVDVGMPLLNGLEAARRVREHLPNVRLVFLTMIEDANLAAAVLELGRSGFVLKHAAIVDLLTAIDHVWLGKPYVSPGLRPQDWVEQRNRARQFHKPLTNRQCDIVQLFAEGFAMKEIAGRLNLSIKTIEFHKHQIMTEFNLKSNADLVLLGVKEGLISLGPDVRFDQRKIS